MIQFMRMTIKRDGNAALRNMITKIIFKCRRKGLERLTLCNNFHENPIIHKKVIEV